jgi:integrase
MARGAIVNRELEDGTKRYDTVIRVNGKQRWRTFTKKREAEDYLDHHSTDIRDGTYREIKKASFSEYAAMWRQTHLIPESFKPSTYNSYCCILDRHLIPELGPYGMTAITAQEINALIAKLLKGDPTAEKPKAPVSKKTVRNVLNLLSEILSKARTEGYLKVSPMADVEKPKIEKEKKGRALRPDEIQSILRQCGDDFRLMFLTALLTGIRRGELFGLWWEDVDWNSNVIQVRRALYWLDGKNHEKAPGATPWTYVTPKSEKSVREIDLSPALRKELLELYMRSPKTGLVFRTSNGTPLRPANITRRSFGTLLRKVEAERAKEKLPAIGPVRWHDLRHTFGSMKLEQGENIYYVQRQMGHSSIQVTIDIYGHLLETRKPEAAAKTDALLFGKN